MSNTAKSSLPYPTLANVPNVPSDMQALASALDGLVVPKYASATARNTANPSPADGDMCYQTDVHAYLTYNSSQASWLTLGVAVYAKGVLATAPTTITVSSIPATSRHLKLIVTGHTNAAVFGAGIFMTFNGISTASYNSINVTNTASAGPTRAFGSASTSMFVGELPGTSYNAAGRGVLFIDIPGYVDTTFRKLTYFQSFASDGGAVCSMWQGAGELSSTAAAVTSFTLTATTGFTIGTEYVLLGVG